MRRYYLLLICFLLTWSWAKASEIKPVILIQPDSGYTPANDNEARLFHGLSIYAEKEIKEEFPGTEIWTLSSVQQMANGLREFAILGDEKAADGFSSLLSNVTQADYLFYITVRIIGKQFFLGLRLDDPYAKNIGLMRKTESRSSENELMDLIDDFVKEMAYFEICPYRGDLNITINSETNNRNDNSYGTFCNNKPGTYKMWRTTKGKSSVEWSLSKIAKYKCDGNVDGTFDEEFVTHIENPCHACPSGTVGFRKSHEVVTRKSSVEKLSAISVSHVSKRTGENESFKDARARIVFRKDGTYLIEIKASSDYFNGDIHEREEVEGICETQGKDKTHQQLINIPLNVILGPFNGTPWDKQFADQGEKPVNNPEINETGTYSYSFNLSRR